MQRRTVRSIAAAVADRTTSAEAVAADTVERIERYHRDYNEFEIDAPLFASRGLFTTRG